jgi:hypothetical protein
LTLYYYIPLSTTPYSWIELKWEGKEIELEVKEIRENGKDESCD